MDFIPGAGELKGGNTHTTQDNKKYGPELTKVVSISHAVGLTGLTLFRLELPSDFFYSNAQRVCGTVKIVLINLFFCGKIWGDNYFMSSL